VSVGVVTGDLVMYLHVLHSCCFVEAGVDYRSLRGYL
jgi:hypothetical protein